MIQRIGTNTPTAADAAPSVATRPGTRRNPFLDLVRAAGANTAAAPAATQTATVARSMAAASAATSASAPASTTTTTPPAARPPAAAPPVLTPDADPFSPEVIRQKTMIQFGRWTTAQNNEVDISFQNRTDAWMRNGCQGPPPERGRYVTVQDFMNRNDFVPGAGDRGLTWYDHVSGTMSTPESRGVRRA